MEARYRLALVAAVMGVGCSLVDAARGDDRAGDAAPGAGGDAATACGITDDFEDTAAGAAWVPYDDDGAAVAESGGALRVSFTGTEESWAGYDTRDRFDFSEGEVRVEIDAAGGHYTGFDLCFGDMELELYIEDGETVIGDVYGTDEADAWSEITYDPILHRILRIRIADSMVHWEVSQTGEQWDPVHTQAAPFSLEDLLVSVEAGGTTGDPPAAFGSFVATPTGCAR